jgi:uncharacterized protein YjbI with pentapeptide repeats
LAFLAVLVALSAPAVAAPAAGAARRPLKVKTFDPFYPLVERRYEPTPELGATINGCALHPLTSCPGAEFEELSLPGVDLSRSSLRRASLRSSLPDASLAISDLREADLNGTKAPALTAPYAHFGKADMAGFEATLGRLAGINARGAEMYEAGFFAADLAGADLRGVDFASDDLSGAVLSGADLRGTKFDHPDLEFADLSHADLRGVSLKGARFCDTVMPDGKVRNARKRCELPPLYIASEEGTITVAPTTPAYSVVAHAGATVRGRHREKCGFICAEGGQWLTHLRAGQHAYARMRGAKLAGRDLALANFSFADLSGADLERSILAGAAASEASFRGATLNGADLTYGEFAGSDLRAATLAGTDARRADFTGADLEGADLSGARLGAASLTSADLRSARLEGVDLSGADLAGAKVDSSFPAGAILCNTVMPDGSVAAPGQSCAHR